MVHETEKSFWRRFLDELRHYFTGGVLVIVPVILTLGVLYFFFQKVDGILSPLLRRVLGYSIPGMGVITTAALIVLVGLLTRNVIGARIHAIGEILFIRTPLVRALYSAIKQLVEAVALPQKKVFDQVVLIEYPRSGALTLAFVSSRFQLRTERFQGNYVAVFVPSTPTPVSGWVIIVPREDVIPLQMSTEEAVKLLVSGGIATPDVLQQKTLATAPQRLKEFQT
jgi:uncharacterized membrane protein